MKTHIILIVWLFIFVITSGFCGDDYHWQSPNTYLQSAILEGDYYDIGYRAAMLSGITYDQSMVKHFNKYYDDYFKKLSPNKSLRKILKTYFHYKLIYRMRKRISNKDKEYIKGVADAFNVSPKLLEKAFILPDGLHAVVTDGLKVIRSFDGIKADDKKLHRSLLSRLISCSSFSAHSNKSKKNNRILARNLDYIGQNILDKGTGVYLIKPKGKYKHIVVSPQGFPIAGITTMNEKGLVLVTHSTFTKSYKIWGSKPLLSVNRMVIENAKSIEEAWKIYKKYPVFTGWLIHLSDRDETTNVARSAVIELNPKGNAISWGKNDYHVLSNHYTTSKAKKNQLETYTGAEYHNLTRYFRLKQLVEKSSIDLEKAIEILQDSYSPYSKTEVDFSPSSIRVPDQLNSVVFMPDELAVYVAEGPAPTSFSNFYKFSFDQMENGREPELFEPKNKKVTEAFKSYLKAYAAIVTDKNELKGEKYLEEAYEKSGDCSYDLIYGAILMGNSKIDKSHDILLMATECKMHNPQQSAINQFLLGLYYHYIDEHETAFFYYENALNITESIYLKNAILKVSKKEKIDKDVLLDYSSIDIKYMDTIW
ncbi:MAG: hypothetical protein KAQ98_06620 [Bacteriovoracaceae bacterium]|nr:hypothetical protein [Bacteriovoracaceae bacterium]